MHTNCISLGVLTMSVVDFSLKDSSIYGIEFFTTNRSSLQAFHWSHWFFRILKKNLVHHIILFIFPDLLSVYWYSTNLSVVLFVVFLLFYASAPGVFFVFLCVLRHVFTFIVCSWYVVMLVGLSRTAVSATTTALLFVLTVILSTIIMFILFLSEMNWIWFDWKYLPVDMLQHIQRTCCSHLPADSYRTY